METFKGFNRMRLIDTCHDCKDRYPACHDHCEKYKKAKEKYREQTSIIKQAKQRIMDIDRFHGDAVYKSKKFH